MALDIEINGKRQPVEAAEPVMLSALLQILELRPDRIAVERNGQIVPRTRWTEEQVVTGDRIEIVHFVGGGTSSIYALTAYS